MKERVLVLPKRVSRHSECGGDVESGVGKGGRAVLRWRIARIGLRPRSLKHYLTGVCFARAWACNFGRDGGQ